MILFRPTGVRELALVASLAWRAWPPRLPDQPIFYPVLSLEYARRIARDWNARDAFSGFVGFVTMFELGEEFARRYPVQRAGGDGHEELWVPASELETFNAHILGSIDVVEAHVGSRFAGCIDPPTSVPAEIAQTYRARLRVHRDPVVREARSGDAEASIRLLVASITTLCIEDHANDPPTLNRWLRNKTVDNFERWLTDPGSLLLVAELGSTIVGVALLHESGNVYLCYVLPGLQGYGVGRALLGRIELEAKDRGLADLRLKSSGTARGFYERLGYVPDGEASTTFGVLKEYPFVKDLRTRGGLTLV
jgi:GNAT superfamily N-acetyltransferase